MLGISSQISWGGLPLSPDASYLGSLTKLTNLQGAAMLACGQLTPWFLVLTAAAWHFSQSPGTLLKGECGLPPHPS